MIASPRDSVFLMSKAPIMPFYTDAYLADTGHLTTEAHGAYLLLLLHCWRCNGAPVADDDRLLARIVKATPRRWRILRRDLLPFFDITDGHWRQKKLLKTWEEVTRKIELNREKAFKSHDVRRRSVQGSGSGAARAPAPAAQDAAGVPSINQDPESINHSEKNYEKIKIQETPTDTPALDALKPILANADYFLPGRAATLAPAMKPQVEAALREAQVLAAPASSAEVSAAVSRIFAHFPPGSGDAARQRFADYCQLLAEYPADLLHGACRHVITTHKYHTLPKIADLAAFADPELTRRRFTIVKLQKILAKME